MARDEYFIGVSVIIKQLEEEIDRLTQENKELRNQNLTLRLCDCRCRKSDESEFAGKCHISFAEEKTQKEQS
jgi:uncharacterized protein YlaI